MSVKWSNEAVIAAAKHMADKGHITLTFENTGQICADLRDAMDAAWNVHQEELRKIMNDRLSERYK